MTIAAFVVSVLAVAIAGMAAWYTHRADRRAGRAETRAEDAERRAEDAERVAALERIGGIMREAAVTQGATALDPTALPRLKATLARLEAAIIVAGVALPASSEYARTADGNSLLAAEVELERAIGSGRKI